MVKEKGWRRPSPFFRPRGTLLLLRHSIFFALSFFHLPPPFSPLFIFIRHGWLAWEKEEEERWRAGVKAPEEEVAEDDFEKKGREERKRRSWVCFILPSPSTPPQKSEGKRELLPRKGEGSTNERTRERTCAPNARLSKKRRGGGNFAKKIFEKDVGVGGGGDLL